jgi:hypothetical protein
MARKPGIIAIRTDSQKIRTLPGYTGLEGWYV